MILEYYTMDDIDKETLRKYRQIFEIRNDGHVWNVLDDKTFLEKLGGYRRDRREGKEGLTLAGLLMFGDGLAIRDEFDNIFMDYRNESQVTADIRWNDRITYDGTWETLKVIKRSNEFEFTNPGILKLPVEDIYRGGNSKSRNPCMQAMLRMVGFGDNAGSGFPAILATWKNAGWMEPMLEEDTRLNQVTLMLKMIPESQERQENHLLEGKQSAEKSADKTAESKEKLSDRHKQILSIMDADVEYSAEEIAGCIGLKGSRTRQLLKELADKGKISFTAATKNRKCKKL